ncbi:hypothetical protein LCGC14_0360400 [marine sediment metagenome]|uniref:Uncharacterized protein n=1 Tax=marine sediment metagenome TaxID=412755 RepID=A0A0F9VVL0_9ZZZZ
MTPEYRFGIILKTEKEIKMARLKGSKNKPKTKPTSDLNSKAESFAARFIAGEGSVDAEILAIKILEKIRASRERLRKKYGDKL